MSTTTNQPPPAVKHEGAEGEGVMFAEHIVEPVTEQVTTFVEAGCRTTRNANAPQYGMQLISASEKLPETTSGILERPYRVTTFKWSQEQTVNDTVYEGELFSLWLANPNFSRVLSLYEFVRADFTITVQVNAQAFNAGMLCGAAYPAFGDQDKPNCTRNIRGLSGMRSLKMDIADETASELVVNWFAPTSHMRTLPSGTTYSQWLGFRLAVYAPLTGAGDVDITIWLTARNVELAMPRGIARAPPPQITNEPIPDEEESGEIQSAQVESAEANVLEKGNNVIRQVTEAVGTAATWWTTIGSIFVALGLSKPRIKEPPMRMQPNVMEDMGACDGVSSPKMMAVFRDNAVDTAPIRTLDPEDPHIIANIIKQPTYLETVRWVAQDQPERVISVIPNSPDWESQILGYNTGTFARSWLSYFSSIFRFWNGSITYRFHFVKTKFHSGRIEVSYVPFETVSTTDRDHTNAFRTILDIREASIFDVTVPYVFPTELMRSQDATGTLFVKVVNDLVVGGGAAPYVDIVIERYSTDMTFAVPSNIPQTQMVPQVPEGEVQLCEEKIVSLELFPKPQIPPVKVCSYTVGEIVTDLRQLMKRYLWIYTSPADSTYNRIRPFYGPPQRFDDEIQFEIRDYMGAFAQLFGFMTGGVRWLFVGEATMSFNQYFTAVRNDDGFRYVGGAGPMPEGGATIYKTHIEPTAEIQVPYYARTPFVQSCGYEPSSLNIWRGREHMCAEININIMAQHSAFRSVAEDFAFGLLLGPPETQPRAFSSS